MTNNNFRARAAISAVLEQARIHYGFDVPVTINFRNTGKTAGLATRRGFEYGITLNTQMLSDEHIDNLINDTIPHEIAHLVCYFDRSLGKNHDRGWKRVCMRLGGNGNRCHSYNVQKARRSRKAIYVIAGKEIEIGVAVHTKIQRGAEYTLRSSKATIKPEYFTGKVVVK